MKKLIATTLLAVALLCMCIFPAVQPVVATPINSVDIQLGSFTGPETGTAQDDNVKASLDLAHIDLDAIIANQAGTSSLIAGKTYSLTMNMGAANDDDLFLVAGGPISITNLSFYCTTDVASTNTWTIMLDHVDKDVEFTTAVDVAAANDGDRIVFSAANPSVITILALTTNVGSGNPMIPWFCPAGMLEVVNDDSTQVGVFDVYITFIPLADGVSVTAQ